MKNISIVIYSLSGGAGRVVINLVNSLSRQGYSFKVYCSRYNKVLLEECGSDVVCTGSRSLLNFAFKVSLDKAIDDDVLVFDPILGSLVTLVLVPRGKSVVWRILTATEYTLSDRFIRRLFQRKLINFSSRFCRGVIANSQGSRASFLKIAVSLDKNKVKVVYNPVGLPSPKGEFSKSDFGYKDDCRLIVSAGRLEYQKGYDILVDAFYHLKNISKIPVKLLILGDGSERPRLTRKINDCNLERDIVLLGEVSNISEYLRFCDVFVLSSRFEGFGNVIVEALHFGLPAVVTDCESGPSEIINSEDVGFIARVESSGDLMAKMNMALNKDWDVRKIKDRAGVFSIERLSCKYKNTLDSFFSK